MIALEADRQVTVRAVDANGLPVAGVGIHVKQQQENARFVLMQPDVGTTNAKGLLVWRHMQEFARADGNARSVNLSATMLGARFGRTELPLDDLPSEPVTVEVPAHWTLVARVIDVDGRPRTPVRLDVRCRGSFRRLVSEDLKADARGDW